MMNLLIDDLQTQLARKISENYDDLIFSLLECYGITRKNWRDHVDRILIVDAGWPSCTKHFCIDNVYAFSITEESEMICDDEHLDYKYQVKYKVEYIESMRGVEVKYEKETIDITM